MTKKSYVRLLAAALALASMVRAQNAESPVPVPAASEIALDKDNISLKTSLDRRHAELMVRFNAWKSRADAFNKKYAGREFDEDSTEAKKGADEQAALSAMVEQYNRDAATFKTDVARLRPWSKDTGADAAAKDDAEGLRVLNGINALARRLGWEDAELKRLNTALNQLKFDGDDSVKGADVRKAWRAIEARSDDGELAKEAAQGDGRGFPGAGLQTTHNDCAIFALANATGRPYGFVAAQAAEILRQGDWRTASERADPQKAIEQRGLNGGEVVMLAEAFGQAEVIPSSAFPQTLRDGRPVLINVVPYNGDFRGGHEVVLTKTFQHNGETWFEMMDSNEEPLRRLYLSNKELGTLLQESGVAFKPEKNRIPQLLRSSGAP